MTTIFCLPIDCLVKLAEFLDTGNLIVLMRCSKYLMTRLRNCNTVWANRLRQCRQISIWNFEQGESDSRNQFLFDIIDNTIKLECCLLNICCKQMRGTITSNEAIDSLKSWLTEQNNVHIAAAFLGDIVRSSMLIKAAFPMINTSLPMVSFSLPKGSRLFTYILFRERLIHLTNQQQFIVAAMELYYIVKEKSMTTLISNAFNFNTKPSTLLPWLHPSVAALIVCAEARACGCDYKVIEDTVIRMSKRVWHRLLTLLEGPVKNDAIAAFPSDLLTRQEIVQKLDPVYVVQLVVSSVVEEGFRGNFVNFESLSNSWMDSVCSTKLGIPISLCAVACSVAYSVGVPVNKVGLIGFPGIVHLGVHIQGINTRKELRYFDLFHVMDGHSPQPLDLATIEAIIQTPIDRHVSTTFMTFTDIGRRCIANILNSERKRFIISENLVQGELKEIIRDIFSHEHLILNSMGFNFARSSS